MLIIDQYIYCIVQQFNNNDQAESNRERKKKPSKPREEKKRQPTLPQPVKMSKKEIQAEQSKRNRVC